jgi:hypothetical protein
VKTLPDALEEGFGGVTPGWMLLGTLVAAVVGFLALKTFAPGAAQGLVPVVRGLHCGPRGDGARARRLSPAVPARAPPSPAYRWGTMPLLPPLVAFALSVAAVPQGPPAPQAEPPALTADDLRAAGRVAGLEFTDKELDLMLRTRASSSRRTPRCAGRASRTPRCLRSPSHRSCRAWSDAWRCPGRRRRAPRRSACRPASGPQTSNSSRAPRSRSSVPSCRRAPRLLRRTHRDVPCAARAPSTASCTASSRSRVNALCSKRGGSTRSSLRAGIAARCTASRGA